VREQLQRDILEGLTARVARRPCGAVVPSVACCSQPSSQDSSTFGADSQDAQEPVSFRDEDTDEEGDIEILEDGTICFVEPKRRRVQ
jgi:hypothetical protein